MTTALVSKGSTSAGETVNTDLGSHLFNQPSHSHKLIYHRGKKIEDWLISLNHQEAGNTFHRMILMFLELMSVLVQRVINCFDRFSEM